MTTWLTPTSGGGEQGLTTRDIVRKRLHGPAPTPFLFTHLVGCMRVRYWYLAPQK